MRKYRVFVHGRNFLITGDGAPVKHGFFTTRFVEADDPVAAEDAAVEQLRRRQSLRDVVLNAHDDPPTMDVTEVVELALFDGIESLDTGLILYVGDGSSGDGSRA